MTFAERCTELRSTLCLLKPQRRTAASSPGTPVTIEAPVAGGDHCYRCRTRRRPDSQVRAVDSASGLAGRVRPTCPRTPPDGRRSYLACQFQLAHMFDTVRMWMTSENTGGTEDGVRPPAAMSTFASMAAAGRSNSGPAEATACHSSTTSIPAKRPTTSSASSSTPMIAGVNFRHREGHSRSDAPVAGFGAAAQGGAATNST